MSVDMNHEVKGYRFFYIKDDGTTAILVGCLIEWISDLLSVPVKAGGDRDSRFHSANLVPTSLVLESPRAKLSVVPLAAIQHPADNGLQAVAVLRSLSRFFLPSVSTMVFMSSWKTWTLSITATGLLSAGHRTVVIRKRSGNDAHCGNYVLCASAKHLIETSVRQRHQVGSYILQPQTCLFQSLPWRERLVMSTDKFRKSGKCNISLLSTGALRLVLFAQRKLRCIRNIILNVITQLDMLRSMQNTREMREATGLPILNHVYTEATRFLQESNQRE